MKKITGVPQTGYIESKVDNTHHVLGGSLGVAFETLRPSKDWGDSLPEGENQFNAIFDSYNCTGFNTLNVIEIYMKAKFGITVNYSDRWLGIIAGTKPPGNDPHTVMEAIRQYGLIPEEMLPWTDDIQSVDEYYSFKGADKEACIAEGKKWLSQFNFYHKWVFTSANTLEEKIANMKQALAISPLGIAVYAWATDENGRYIRLGNDCHWTAEYAYPDYQKIDDSYPPYQKIIDQEIFSCKVIYIEKNQPNISLWASFWNWLKKIYERLA